MAEKAPSAYAIEDVVVAWQRYRDRLLTDNPGIDPETLDEMLGPMTGDVEEIQTRLVRARQARKRDIAGVEAEKAELRDQIDGLNNRQKRFEAQEAMCKALLMSTLVATGRKGTMLPIATLSINKGVARPRIINIDEVPDQYVTIETVLVRKPKPELYTALRDGEVIPGAELSNPMPHLQISPN